MSVPTKLNLINDVQSVFEEITDWYSSQEDVDFNKVVKKDKWTAAGHLYHLVKTTSAINKGMQMPKIVLKSLFGKCNRVERTFMEQHTHYLNTLGAIVDSGKEVTPPSNVVPEEGRAFKVDSLLKRWKKGGDDFCYHLQSWSEEDLGIYLVPHPLMGKLALREITYFTIFHTNHHLDNLKENYTPVS